MAENVKKKPVVKSKLSKPNPKQKQHTYSIEVGMDSVRVIKVDPKGQITGSGVASYGGDAMWSDNAWVDRLSQCVRAASREAKVPKGTGFLCSVVSGGPNVIVQRFIWPELGHQAMLENAKHEIASYLPGTVSNFVISAEVQARNEAEGGKAATIEVFVAAMPKDMATAISTAVAWAGFKIAKFDISENVRTRLVKRYCSVGGNLPASYGIMDLSGANPHITLYLDGFFYSTHYFTGAQNPTVQGATIEEIEARNASVGDAFAGGAEVEHDAGAYLSELTFVVDFIKYQERASNLECILIYGRTQPGFAERISSGLDIPVYPYDEWMNTAVLQGVKGDPGQYLDVYASGIPSAVVGAQHMMDLKTAVIVKNPMRRLIIQASAMVAAMLALLAIGIAVPLMIQMGHLVAYHAMDAEYDEVTALRARANALPLEATTARVSSIRALLAGINAFYTEFAQASVIVPIIFDAEIDNIRDVDEDQGFTQIFRVSASQDDITIGATAVHFDHVAGLIEYFREMMFLTDAAGNAARFRTDANGNPVIEDGRFILDENGDTIITRIIVDPVLDENGNPVLEENGTPIFVSSFPEQDYWPHAQFLFRNTGAGSVREGDTREFELGTADYVLSLIMRRGMGVR